VESKHAFNLFTQDQRGQRWRGVFDSLDQATRVAREIADRMRLECFVYDAKAGKEVGRYFPPVGGARTQVKAEIIATPLDSI
jgi:hypothetical protein